MKVADKGRIERTVGGSVIIEVLKTSSLLRYGTLELFAPEQTRDALLIGKVIGTDQELKSQLKVGDYVIYEAGRGASVNGFEEAKPNRLYLWIREEYLLAKIMPETKEGV